jgi:hypothetical protein
MDTEYMESVLKMDGDLLAAMGEHARNDKHLAMIALESSGTAYLCLSDKLKRDIEVCRLAVKSNGTMYRYIPREYKSIKDILLSALDTYPSLFLEVVRNGTNLYEVEEALFIAISACECSKTLETHLMAHCTKMVEKDPTILYKIHSASPVMGHNIADKLGIDRDSGYAVLNIKKGKR